MFKRAFQFMLLIAMPLFSQTPTGLTHLGVPASSLITIDLNARVDLSSGKITTDVGTYQNGIWKWLQGADAFEVPKGKTFIVTDAQAWILHEPGTGLPASLELQVESPYAGYSGTMATFSFHEVPANASGVQRQDWTSGFSVPQGLRIKLWVQAYYPQSLMSNARILVHGYFL